jgi:hypothetical protein
MPASIAVAVGLISALFFLAEWLHHIIIIDLANLICIEPFIHSKIKGKILGVLIEGTHLSLAG